MEKNNQPIEYVAQPGEELRLPEEYKAYFVYDVKILTTKPMRSFQCRCYDADPSGKTWVFSDVIFDTSEYNARGNLKTLKATYYPELILANVGFMAVPIASPAPSD